MFRRSWSAISRPKVSLTCLKLSTSNKARDIPLGQDALSCINLGKTSSFMFFNPVNGSNSYRLKLFNISIKATKEQIQTQKREHFRNMLKENPRKENVEKRPSKKRQKANKILLNENTTTTGRYEIINQCLICLTPCMNADSSIALKKSILSSFWLCCLLCWPGIIGVNVKPRFHLRPPHSGLSIS